MIVSIYDCFHIPFIIGFKPSYSETYMIEIIDFIVDFFYLLDILIKFRTTYYAINTQQNSTFAQHQVIDKQVDSYTDSKKNITHQVNGYEVYDPKLIAITYLKSARFYIDTVAFIPFSKIFWGQLSFD